MEIQSGYEKAKRVLITAPLWSDWVRVRRRESSQPSLAVVVYSFFHVSEVG